MQQQVADSCGQRTQRITQQIGCLRKPGKSVGDAGVIILATEKWQGTGIFQQGAC